MCGSTPTEAGLFFLSFFSNDIPLVEFMYLVFKRMPGESYRRPLRSCLCCFFV